MIAKIPKETCGPCKKFINIGQPILECENCNIAIHTKCFKKGGFTNTDNLWVCSKCSDNVLPRYNPFALVQVQESDKFYENDCESTDKTLQSLISTLNECKPYDSTTLTDAAAQINDETNTLLSTLFLNLDGNFTNFDTLLAELKRIAHPFQILGLAETNVDEPLKDLYKIPNYESFYQSTLQGKAKGTGVALYVKNDLTATVIEKVGFCTSDIESIFVQINNTPKPLTIGVIYRPPSGSVEKFLEALKFIFSNVPKGDTRILGDYNIDLLKESSPDTEAFETLFIQNSFAPVISIPTHERQHCKSTCIDNILTNNIECTLISGTLPENRVGEDHVPIFEISAVNLPKSGKNQKCYKFYDFSKANTEKFVAELESKIPCLRPSENFSEFADLFNTLLDNTCKLSKPKLTKRTPTNNPWISDQLSAAIDKKHELRKDWTDTKSKTNKEGDPILHEKFRKYRSILKHIINTAKKSYTCEKILENKENSKKTWEIINDLRGKSKNAIKPPFLINNEKIYERRVIANEFNKYFNSIASKLNDTIADQNINLHAFGTFEDFLLPSIPNSIFLDDCDSDEILKIIREFDNNKASDIPIRIIKKSAHVICDPLSQYFNILMKSGKFPDVLKVGKITPVYKKGNPEELGNYRPVSTLPIFGKIFEKILYSRIYSFAISQNILNENQFGFRQSHSTCHAVNYSVSLIQEALRENNHVLGIFIDLSKAFDTIDHRTLLAKLNRYGIRGTAGSLIESYLSKRTHYTELLKEKSDELVIQFGVPQGSVLGPLLFLLYINDITRLSNLGVYVLFADDTNIFVKGKTANEAYEKGNQLLKCLSKYMIINKLHVNMSKCCYMHFKPKSSSAQDENISLRLEVDDFVIKKCTEARFLGVIIDDKLNWDAHIRFLKRKLNYTMATLHRIIEYIPKHLHRNLYYILFESHLSYCISVWGSAAQHRISSLWTIQKQCVRVLFGDRDAYLDKFKTCARARPFNSQALNNKFYTLEHTKPLFKNQEILSIHNLYTYHCFMETFKILKFRQPISLFNKYEISVRKPTMLKSSFPSQSFTDRSTSLWNCLAPKFKLPDFSVNVSFIKSKLKSALFSNQHIENPLTWTTEDYNTAKVTVS